MALLYSVLDLSPVPEGGDAALAFRNSVDLARHAERWGYHRYWLAEHHNMPGIASAATSVLIGHIAGSTERIRVGSGGVMLPNHAPLVVAEQFGTLESLYPGRIDLGLGRAPGTDRSTARALRRHLGGSGDTFPQDVAELQSYFASTVPGQPVRAVPGAGLRVPLYLLGSSDFSARFAAKLGLPFAFASHFAPEYLHEALHLYRRDFQPSSTLTTPHTIVGVGVYAAETDRQAQRLFTSAQQQTLALIRGEPSLLRPPVHNMDALWSDIEQRAIQKRTRYSAVGSAKTVREHLHRLRAETDADEMMAVGQIFNHDARLRSFEIAADVFQQISAPNAALR
ncbi:MAG: LLM class flavin-dependent oxidoreductase [Chthoniobacterales bacterium]|nr:LLM class flavin-dependent oxidoreductase [Chthoniobacterales bacterium]